MISKYIQMKIDEREKAVNTYNNKLEILRDTIQNLERQKESIEIELALNEKEVELIESYVEHLGNEIENYKERYEK